jgi:two-component system chemotaxis response regulator CheB
MMQQGADSMYVEKSIEKESAQFLCKIMVGRIKEMIRAFHENTGRIAKYANEPIRGKPIAIGASTGGTETILEILEQLPENTPPILIVQHMPPVFTRFLAERADKLCKMQVWEARDGDRLANGLALLAPGGFHMVLEGNPENNQWAVRLHQGEPLHSQRPAVDELFNSIAKTLGKNAIGVILTGMGEDGAAGMKNMRENGAYTIGQNEETCVVYGMPKAAYDVGAVCKQLPLQDIAKEIMSSI